LAPRHLTEESRFGLGGKSVVVTGGLGLIGQEICQAFAEQGARVVVVDQDSDRWSAYRSVCAEAKDMEFFASDMADVEKLPDAVTEIDRSCGGAWAWVNGHYPRTNDWGVADEAVTPGSWSKNIEYNLTSYCVASSTIARLMAQRGGGSIINISSIYGVVGPDFSVYDGLDMTTPAPYPAIKAGIIGHTRYLATLWGAHGVRANAVCPGGVANSQPRAFVEAYSARTPLGRLAQPDEVAGPVVFLASPASSYVTGSAVMIDGGWSAQ
jgi:NAD(P)-dependent dehydrogenase (short-subunit alcohol dehydrogenase family)